MEQSDLLNLDESVSVELKSGKTKIPLSFYETYSAFGNTSGGTIYLGIAEAKKTPHILEGVENAKAKKKQLFDAISNRSKVSAKLCDEEDIEILSFPEGDVLKVYVHEAPIRDKPVFINGDINVSYYRSESGDHTLSQEQIESFLNDKADVRFDCLPNELSVELEDLDPESLRQFVEAVKEAGKIPSSASIDARTILMRAGAYSKKRGEKEFRLNNGAILFLGKSADILSLRPNLWLDFSVTSETSERFVDRVTNKDIFVEGNMFQFYVRSLQKALASAPSPFYLEGDKNVGKKMVMKMLREAFANAISNLDLFDPRGLRIETDGNGIRFTNAGTMLVPLEKALVGGTSLPRNPAIFSLFQAMGISDHGGYGIPFLFDAAKELSLSKPVLVEDKAESETTLQLFYHPKKGPYGKEEESILAALGKSKGFLGILEIAERAGLSRDKTRRGVESLLRAGLIVDNGKTTKGRAFALPINAR